MAEQVEPGTDAYVGMQGINSSSMETHGYEAAGPPPLDGPVGGSSCTSRDRKD